MVAGALTGASSAGVTTGAPIGVASGVAGVAGIAGVVGAIGAAVMGAGIA